MLTGFWFIWMDSAVAWLNLPMGSGYLLCHGVTSLWTPKIDFRRRLYWSVGFSWLAFSSTKGSPRGVELMENEAISRLAGCKPSSRRWGEGGAMDHSVHNEQSFNSKFPVLKVNGRVISWTEIVAEKKGRLMEVENVQCIKYKVTCTKKWPMCV